MTASGPPEVSLGIFLVVGVVALAAGLGHWWLRGRHAAAEGPIQLVASRSLGGKRLLTIVEIDGERFLLGLTEDRITCLGRLEDTVSPAVRALPEMRAVG